VEAPVASDSWVALTLHTSKHVTLSKKLKLPLVFHIVKIMKIEIMTFSEKQLVLLLLVLPLLLLL
jgi:hypothetical protein